MSTHSRMARLPTRTPEITARSSLRCTRRFRPTSWMHSLRPVCRARTDAVIDEVRLKRAHALAALAQYGWALRRPDEQHRTGRTPDQTRAWAIEAVTRAAADSS